MPSTAFPCGSHPGPMPPRTTLWKSPAGLKNFNSSPLARPASGAKLDMRLIEPITAIPPRGGHCAAQPGECWRSRGVPRRRKHANIDGGSYIDPNVKARGVQTGLPISTQDPQHLLFYLSCRAPATGRATGGQRWCLEHWLLPNPGAAVIQPGGIGVARAAGDRKPVGPFRPAPPVIPVECKVTAAV